MKGRRRQRAAERESKLVPRGLVQKHVHTHPLSPHMHAHRGAGALGVLPRLCGSAHSSSFCSADSPEQPWQAAVPALLYESNFLTLQPDQRLPWQVTDCGWGLGRGGAGKNQEAGELQGWEGGGTHSTSVIKEEIRKVCPCGSQGQRDARQL